MQGTMIATSCEIIRVIAAGTERDMSYYIDRINEVGAGGWSPETRPMRDLEHSARVLKMLATQIDIAREAMIQAERIST